MSLGTLINRFLKAEQLSHRPRLSPRFWLYAAAAYLIPVVVQVVLPSDPGLSDELSWLVTLAPAYLLSLHYGLRGAFAGLLMGTALFVAVQAVVALNFTPDDWRITVPIYISYGALAISVGWLSEELHSYYQLSLKNERMATIGQVAVTLRHELTDALSVIAAQSEMLANDQVNLTESQKASVQMIRESALTSAHNIEKLTNLVDAPVMTYGGIKLIDLNRAQTLTDREDT